MSLQGSAIITLTDTKTGKQEIRQENNMFTSALDYILNTVISLYNLDTVGTYANAGSNGQRTAISNVIWGMLPLYEKLLGGILLIKEPLLEDENNIIPKSLSTVGYAGQNSSADVNNNFLGTFIPSLSGPTSDGKGYTLVWEFNTVQANGTIKALALTSDKGGRIGWNYLGTRTDGVSFIDELSELTGDYRGFTFPPNALHKTNIENYVIDIELKQNILYVTQIKYNPENSELSIVKYTYNDTIHLLDKDRNFKEEVIFTHTLPDMAYLFNDHYLIFPVYSYTKDSQNKIIKKLSHIGYYSNTTSVKILNIKTKQIDRSFTVSDYNANKKEAFIYNNILFFQEQRYCYLVDMTIQEDQTILTQNIGNIYLEGRFFLSPDQTKLWFDSGKGQDYRYCEFDLDKITKSVTNIEECYQPLDFATSGKVRDNHCTLYSLAPGCYLAQNRGTLMCYPMFVTPYLATINNLKAPLIKDETKTLKIEYTITEA